MKVEDLILQLQDVISAAKSMPFSGGKVMVSSDEIYDILDQIQDAMPAEVRQAKNIVADRKQILAEANRESENIIRSAEERKKAMLNQNELVREAQAKAKEIVDDAKQKSAEIRKAANVYVDSIMKRTEEGVATQLEALRKTHANIVSSQKKQPWSRCVRRTRTCSTAFRRCVSAPAARSASQRSRASRSTGCRR